MKCNQCGQELGEGVKICPICKAPQIEHRNTMGLFKTKREMDHAKGQYNYAPRSRVIAGILQLLFGGFGIGRLYLGHNGIALGQLFTFPIFFIGGIWGFIDGILILCGQVECDANGIPLK